MKRVRQFRLKGGPFDGWEGEYLDRGEDVIRYGPPGEQVYCYRRRPPLPFARRSKADVFRYDRHATKVAMLDAGFSPAEADLAGDGPDRPTDAPGYSQKVSVDRIGDRWVMSVEGVIVDERPAEEVGDAKDAKDWVAQVMLPSKETTNG